ncbi:BEL1-like homeodomain 4 [Olea europaea subsp. europaea]|nr:BEL1-like homeodomain 4 [Olea europaea subsp. europaea]
MRVQGFDPPLLGFQEEESSGLPVYETAGMLSEMFNFSSATELLENQISQNYQNPRQRVPVSWYQNRQGSIVSGSRDSRNHNVGNEDHHISSTNVDSASAMQLFLMNPQQRSPSPSSSSHHHPPPPSAAVIHHPLSTFEAFHQPVGVTTTAGEAFAAAYDTIPIQMPGAPEGQGLSLSLSSSLQEAAKGEHLRVGEGGMFFGQGAGGGSTSVQYSFKNFGGGSLQPHGGIGQNHQLHGASGSPIAAVNLLRNSVYAKAAQELLEEFCSVGKPQFKKNKFSKNTNPSGGGNSSSSLKDQQPLSAADRHEHQRRKVKLISMLDEVDRRYNHYCEQMQMVVNSFDMVMGFGSAAPYTSLAQKAMSRHFRCLKDAIIAQLKHSSELLGEKDASTLGVTKGETPRLRILEQSLRQQRAFHQMGMLEQDTWRPQRGLPEKSISILRAWLFEHFLHPYPSDADKHLLARQTGLSRNQVSNWFINARVRLWKPMIEEMYQQEAKEEARDQTTSPTATSTTTEAAATTVTTSVPPTFTQSSQRSEIYVPENDPSLIAINRQFNSRNQAKRTNTSSTTIAPATASTYHESDTCHRGRIVGLSGYGTINTNAGNADIDSTLIRLETKTAGDVSLTLGLRHAGNVPENNQFSLKDFGGF